MRIGLLSRFVLILILSFTSLSADTKNITIEQNIAGLYIAYFNRAPDKNGLEYWKTKAENATKSGKSASDIMKELSSGFASHPTFISTYSSLDNREFVKAIYKNVLGKDGDSEGINYWTSYIDGGKSRSDMVSDFVQISLSSVLTKENYPNLSNAELQIAQERQDLITNKVEVALAFVKVLGDKTNVLDSQNPESDPAYKASIKILESITTDRQTVYDAINYLHNIKNSSDPIGEINGTIPTPPVPPTADTTPPVIKLNGMRKISIFVGDKYTELGATATDNVDGNLTSKIVINGDVNTSKIGKYEITYSVEDKAGNKTTVVRVIQVKALDDIDPIITPTPIPVKTQGHLLELPIEGVEYFCNDGSSGITDSNGTFWCVEAPITFKIGGLTLGTLNKFTANLDDLKIEAKNTYDTDTLKLLARLIISLDDDGNVTERVTITEETRNALTKEQHFKDMTVADVETLLSDIGKTLANECGALEAFGDTNVICNDDGSYISINENINREFILDKSNLPDELKNKIELYGIIENGDGKHGTVGGLTDVVAHKKITYNDIDGNKVEKPVIVYRSFNIGEWKGKINEETTLLARIFIHPNLIEIPEAKKIEYIQFIKTEYSDEYKEALRLQSLSISSSFFAPHYYDVVNSLQTIILSKYLSEQPKQSQKLNRSVFNSYYKYDLKDKSFTNMALMQIKTAGDDIEFANYADVYYGVRVKKYDSEEKKFDYPMLFSKKKLFTVNPVKGGAVGGLYDWAFNQFDVTYKPTTKIKYNELFGVNKDIRGNHKALIELYKWQGGYPTLLNGTRGIALIVKSVKTFNGDAAAEKVMNGVKKGRIKIQKSIENAEKIVYGVDAGLSVIEIGLDIIEASNQKLKTDLEPYRRNYTVAKNVITNFYKAFNVKPYSANVKDFGEIKQLTQLFGNLGPIVPSSSDNHARKILQDKINNISNKKKEYKVIAKALFLSKVIEPLIKSTKDGRDLIKEFNKKYKKTITFSQMSYYLALKQSGEIQSDDIGKDISGASISYGKKFINRKLLADMRETFEKYTNSTAQIAKALDFIKKMNKKALKVIKNPIKAMKSIGAFLIEAEIVNLKAIAGDAILSIIAKANPASAVIKGTQIVNDWSSYLAGNVVVANKQYFQVDFNNGKVDIHLPPVSYSGIDIGTNVKVVSHFEKHFLSKTSKRFLVVVDEESTNIRHKPDFRVFFTEENQDGVFIDGDFEDLLETDAYKNKTIFKFNFNIEQSTNDSEDDDSFKKTSLSINNVEVKSEDIVSADLINGGRNTSYLDIMEVWEETDNPISSFASIKRGLYAESVTLKMMPSHNPEFIVDSDSLKQTSTRYYAYNVANKSLIKDIVELSVEELHGKQVVSIKNNASYSICYEIKYDIEDGIFDKVADYTGDCIASGKTYIEDNLNYGTDDINDIEFYFYDGLAREFFKREFISKPYLKKYQKLTGRPIKNVIAYNVDFDNIDNNTLPPQISKNDIKISTTTQDITLDWNDIDRATSYQVCISTKHITEGNSCEAEGGVLYNSDSSDMNIKENLQPNIVYYIRISGVKDGTNGLWSDEITTSLLERNNTPPTANAGEDKMNVSIGAEIHLSGKDSNDTDGDALSYLWSFVSIPTGSGATLSDNSIVNPTFTADENGTYTIQLIVNDGFVNSTPDTVVVQTDEEAPTKEVNPTSCTPEFD